MRSGAIRLIFPLLVLIEAAFAADAKKPRGMSEILATSQSADWRPLDPESTLYIELPSGRVVIELAPAFAPQHVANIKALARERYFDGLTVVRLQDNYVAQLADPDAEKPERARKIRGAKRTLPPEFETALDLKMPFTPVPDQDVYAPQTGLSDGFPVARDPKSGKMWLVHCYAMAGAGRDNPPESGGGTELYVVIGHAPRQLDRNVTLFGRVVRGIELLSVLPRGTGAMGFYEKAEQQLAIKAVRVAADLPPAERSALEVMRTEKPIFRELIEARRNRPEEWYHYQVGRIEICNVPIPVRTVPTTSAR